MNKFTQRGLNLANLRKKVGLTQKQFGDRYGFKKHQIGYYERTGEIPNELLEALRNDGHDTNQIVGDPAGPYGRNVIDFRTEKVLDELMTSGDEEIIGHLKRQVLLLKDLLDLRRGKR